MNHHRPGACLFYYVGRVDGLLYFDEIAEQCEAFQRGWTWDKPTFEGKVRA